MIKNININEFWIFLPVFVIIIFVFLLNIFPYVTTDHLYIFREDNFWSFESGITRRAAPGQLIWWLDRLTGVGPLLYSLSLYLIFVVGVWVALPDTLRSLGHAEQALFILSPAYLLYSVDSEVFLLIPALALLVPQIRTRPNVVLMIVLGTALFRELALLLYSPLLITYTIRRPIGTMVTAATTIAVIAMLVGLALGAEPFRLEREYWPQRGLPDLTSYGLYNFIDYGLFNVLKLHGSGILRGDFPVNMIFWVLIMIFLSTLLLARSGSPAFTLWFAAVVAASSLLSYDHGRYLYLFVLLGTLITVTPVRREFTEGLDRAVEVLGFATWLDGFATWLQPRLRTVRALALAGLVVVPSAYFAAGDFKAPRFVAFPTSLMELKEGLLRPERPGERRIM